MKKETFYKTLNAIVGAERLNDEEVYIINNYVSDLEYQNKQKDHIIFELEEWLDEIENDYKFSELYDNALVCGYVKDKIQELKERYK